MNLLRTLSFAPIVSPIAESMVANDAVADVEKLKAQGFDKATVKLLVNAVLKADLDGDGDGVKESVSAFVIFKAHTGVIIWF